MATLIVRPMGGGLPPRTLNVFIAFRELKKMKLEHAVAYCRRIEKNGDLIIKMKPGYHKEENTLTKMKFLGQLVVIVTAPVHLNVVRGVVTHPELAHIDEKDVLGIIDEKDQAVYCSKQPNSATAVIGWRLDTHQTPPPSVTLGWDRVRVRPFIPRPRRCYKCQDFGHIAEHCNNELTCATCAESHKTEECPNKKKPYCYSCEEEGHPASSRHCKMWKMECAIKKIETIEKLTYAQAAQVYNSRIEEDQKKNQDENVNQEDDTQERPPNTKYVPSEEEEQETEDEEDDTQERDTQEEEEQENEDQAEDTQERSTNKRPAEDSEEDSVSPPAQTATCAGEPEQSDLKSDSSGGWCIASSRKKKKAFSKT